VDQRACNMGKCARGDREKLAGYPDLRAVMWQGKSTGTGV